MDTASFGGKRKPKSKKGSTKSKRSTGKSSKSKTVRVIRKPRVKWLGRIAGTASTVETLIAINMQDAMRLSRNPLVCKALGTSKLKLPLGYYWYGKLDHAVPKPVADKVKSKLDKSAHGVRCSAEGIVLIVADKKGGAIVATPLIQLPGASKGKVVALGQKGSVGVGPDGRLQLLCGNEHIAVK